MNHPNNKAIVHDTDCGKYTNRRRYRTHNGYWPETFERFEAAWNYVKGIGKRMLTHAPSASGKKMNWR